jgi:hypothetical protein
MQHHKGTTMTKAKNKTESAPAGTTIHGCNFMIENSANENTRDAVVALAAAAQANARAIEAAALALNSASNNTTAIRIN